jgi:hypothetical protein
VTDMQRPGQGRDNPLRLGILCQGGAIQDWQARCISDLLAGGNAALVVVLTASDGVQHSGRQSQPILSRYLSRLSSAGAHRPVPLRRAPHDAPTVACSVHAPSEEQLDAIRRSRLDFILKFSLGAVAEEILNIPRCGVWEFDRDVETSGCFPSCFWELYRDNPVSTATLVRAVGPNGGRVILREGFFKTDEQSYARNTDRLHYEIAKWPARVCADIRRESGDYVEGPVLPARASDNPMPSSLQMLLCGTKIVRNRFRLAWMRLFQHPQWNIGVVESPIHALAESGSSAKVHWFPLSHRDGFLADPFGIPRDGGATILCEYYDYPSGKGRICSVEFDKQKFTSGPQTAIDLPFHLSYPYLVESDGEVFCIPEAHRSREIALFKAESFPSRWTKIAVLLRDVAALDTTVFQYGGRWWLMFTDAEAASDMNLLVWHASDLRGPWSPHARNPVKTDIRSARPAGTPFVHDGQLYRPAQDCSRRYGWRIALNRVTRLTPAEFSEELVGTIDPPEHGPLPAGRHTISAVGNLTLIDGHRFVFVGQAFRAFLGIWFRQIARSITGRRPGPTPGSSH